MQHVPIYSYIHQYNIFAPTGLTETLLFALPRHFKCVNKPPLHAKWLASGLW